MKNNKFIFMIISLLTLTGCTFFSSEDSEAISNGTSGDSSSKSDDFTSSSEVIPGDLESFPTDKIVDPVNSYKEADFSEVNPRLNGFTYPSDAQVKPTRGYLEFWHHETDLDFKITASKLVMHYINIYGSDYEQKYAELYFPVTLEVTMNNKKFTFYEVGMRMKGNTSRAPFLDDNRNVNASVSFKLSFNELWDKEQYAFLGLRKEWTKQDPEYVLRDNRTLFPDDKGKNGIKKLDFKWNKSRDSSLVMQPYIFSFFQQKGLITQNSTLTTLSLNNTKMGVVTINEPTDKHLLRRYLPKAAAAGDLYKVGWSKNGQPGNLDYQTYLENKDILGEEDKYNLYQPAYDAKEFNGDSERPFGLLIDLMEMLNTNKGKQPAQYIAALEDKIDIPSFLNYAAAAYLAGNPDDMRNNSNNYYIFFNPSQNNKAYFIPYDYDWALNLNWGNFSMYDISPFSTKHKNGGDGYNTNPLFWYTICTETVGQSNIYLNQSYQDEYANLVKTHAESEFYSADMYNRVYDTYYATYNVKSGSSLDKNNDKVSPFLNTKLMTDYINNTKETVANYIKTK